MTACARSSRPAWTGLQERREALDLTRADLALLAGVDPVTVWRVETGRVVPNTATLVALGRVLQADLRTLTEPPEAA